MMDDIRAHVSDVTDEDEMRAYIGKIVDKEAFDHKGLVYGMGHAVYSLSDPRAVVFKSFVQQLAMAKGRKTDFDFLQHSGAPGPAGDCRKAPYL